MTWTTIVTGPTCEAPCDGWTWCAYWRPGKGWVNRTWGDATPEGLCTSSGYCGSGALGDGCEICERPSGCRRCTCLAADASPAQA